MTLASGRGVSLGMGDGEGDGEGVVVASGGICDRHFRRLSGGDRHFLLRCRLMSIGGAGLDQGVGTGR